MLNKIINHRKQIALGLLFLAFFVAPLVGWAASGWAPSQIIFDPGENVLRNTRLGVKDPVVVVAAIVNWALSLLGLVALVLIIYAGFLWMLSRGNEEEIKKARDILVGALIGMLIILASYGITSYVFNNLINATDAGFF